MAYGILSHLCRGKDNESQKQADNLHHLPFNSLLAFAGGGSAAVDLPVGHGKLLPRARQRLVRQRRLGTGDCRLRPRHRFRSELPLRILRKLSATVHDCSRKSCTVAESLRPDLSFHPNLVAVVKRRVYVRSVPSEAVFSGESNWRSSSVYLGDDDRLAALPVRNTGTAFPGANAPSQGKTYRLWRADRAGIGRAAGSHLPTRFERRAVCSHHRRTARSGCCRHAPKRRRSPDL